MRLIGFELRKVFLGKWFLRMLIFTVFLNIFALYESCKPDELSPSFAETKAFYGEIADMTDEEKKSYLSEQKEVLEAVFLKESLGRADSPQYNELYEKYGEYHSGNIDYKAARRRSKLVDKALGELNKVSGYDEYLSAVKLNAESLSEISVFSDSLSDFSKDNIRKTAADYEKMKNTEISYDINDGVMPVLNSKTTDFCVLLILIVTAMALITDEKEKGLFRLIRCTPCGTAKTIGSKIAALFLCCVVTNTVICLSSGAFASYAYGLGNLSRSVQSVPDMMPSCLQMNLYGFFALFFTVKTIGVFAVGLIILFICLAAKKSVSVLLWAFFLAGGSFALSQIPETVKLNHFRFINLYSLINPYEILHSYVNLNVFGKAVNVTAIFAFFTIFVISFFCFVLCFYYIEKRPLESREKTARKAVLSERIHSSISFFEFKKLMVLNKTAAILLIFILLQTYNVYTRVNYQSYDDYYYKSFMEMLSGTLTGEKEGAVLNRQAEIEETQAKLDELTEKRFRGEITTAEFMRLQEPYSEILNSADAFSAVYKKYLYIKENPNAEFFYDRGYEKLFGISDKNCSLESAVLCLLFFAFSLSGVFSLEYRNSMYKVLGGTKLGIEETRRIKLLVSAFTAFTIFLLAYLPELIYIGRFYGFPGLTAPLMSIPELKAFGSLPVWCGIGLLYIFRFAVVLLLVPIISALSLLCKNNVSAAAVFSVIFVFPPLLCMIGFEFAEKIGLSSLLTVTVLPGNAPRWLIVIQFMVLFIFSLLGFIFVKRNFGKV